MNFKVDENMPLETSDVLRAAGHEAETVDGEGLGGTDESIVAARFQTEGRAIVTLDLDFSDIRTYPPAFYAGIIVLRPRTQDKLTVLAHVRRFIPLLSSEPLAGHLWIVEADRVRIREGVT